jgi:hypothetical protein
MVGIPFFRKRVNFGRLITLFKLVVHNYWWRYDWSHQSQSQH